MHENSNYKHRQYSKSRVILRDDHGSSSFEKPVMQLHDLMTPRIETGSDRLRLLTLRNLDDARAVRLFWMSALIQGVNASDRWCRRPTIALRINIRGLIWLFNTEKDIWYGTSQQHLPKRRPMYWMSRRMMRNQVPLKSCSGSLLPYVETSEIWRPFPRAAGDREE